MKGGLRRRPDHHNAPARRLLPGSHRYRVLPTLLLVRIAEATVTITLADGTVNAVITIFDGGLASRPRR